MARLLTRWISAGLLAAALMMPAAGAANVQVDGTTLGPEEAWIRDGVSYITLLAFCQAAGYDLTWDGAAAGISRGSFSMAASPGALYIEANDRALYVDGGVGVREGRSYLPLRVLAEATGAELGWDGATATAALNTRGGQPQQANYDQEDLYWLARIISAESRGEPLLGQIAVGNVVLNRVKSSQFPNTIRDVVFDTVNGVQFEPVSNGTVYDEPTQSSILAAKLCLEGANVVGESLYFFAPALSQGTWIVNNATYYKTIGCHRFYL